MTLWINDSGASTTEIQAGVRAAEAYFDRIGWRPGIVYRAMLDDESPHQHVAQDYWSEAETEAFRAAFAGWARWPEAATLVCGSDDA
jgi:hypothetical protein